MRRIPSIVIAAVIAASLVAGPALAQNGTPPADVSQAVTTPTVPGAPPPPPPPPTDTTTLDIAAGGQLATGNSQSAAASGVAKFAIRRGDNVFAASVVANYAANIPSTSNTWTESTENVQGKLRYERYFTTAFSGFLQVTGLHDAFQAIDFRLNIDPGAKLNFIRSDNTKFWGELGYDFQFDANRTDGQGIEQAGVGGPALDPMGLPYVIERTDTIHSVRAFLGFKEAFNKDVTLSLGLEYLQGFGGSNTGLPPFPAGLTAATADLVAISATGSRLNFEALFAAHLVNAFSLGVGFTAKYNSDPLAGKTSLDTATTLTLIYSFASPKPTPPPPPPCVPGPCIPAPPPPPPLPPTTTPAATTATPPDPPPPPPPPPPPSN
jgi:putative salt-induced outer membrane protein YdiY